MTLNVAQYLAPLNSGQVLTGYSQGVKQGVGLTIQSDGTITLNSSGAETLGFLTSVNSPAPVYNWSTIPGGPSSVLVNDGGGSVYFDTSYIQALPTGDPFPHTGGAVIPAGGTVDRPISVPGVLRYNTDFGRLEFFTGLVFLPVSPASGGVFSFVSPTTPIANAPGDFWFDTITNEEYVWTGTQWLSPVTPGIYNLDDISGLFNGTRLTFDLTILGAPYTPNPLSNISVFLGGIAQTPGVLHSYTITGTSITFTAAPLSTTTFYAFTVRN